MGTKLSVINASLPAQHYVDAVEQLVPFERLRKFLAESDLENLAKIFNEQSAAAWGVTPGKRSVTENSSQASTDFDGTYHEWQLLDRKEGQE